MQTKEQPIGVFDSGIGGLTVAKAIRKCLPKESILYILAIPNTYPMEISLQKLLKNIPRRLLNF